MPLSMTCVVVLCCCCMSVTLPPPPTTTTHPQPEGLKEMYSLISFYKENAQILKDTFQEMGFSVYGERDRGQTGGLVRRGLWGRLKKRGDSGGGTGKRERGRCTQAHSQCLTSCLRQGCVKSISSLLSKILPALCL